MFSPPICSVKYNLLGIVGWNEVSKFSLWWLTLIFVVEVARNFNDQRNNHIIKASHFSIRIFWLSSVVCFMNVESKINFVFQVETFNYYAMGTQNNRINFVYFTCQFPQGCVFGHQSLVYLDHERPCLLQIAIFNNQW